MSDPRAVGASPSSFEVEPTPDLLAILRRRWLVIATCAVLGVVAAQLFALTTAPTYEARSTLLLVAAENEVSPGGGRARTVDIDTWATVARSTALLQEVANDLGLDLGVVQSRTAATAATTGDILVLSSTAPSPEQAVEEAEVYSERFLEARRNSVNAVSDQRRQYLEGLQASLQSEIDDLAEQIEEAEDTFAPTSAIAALEADQQIAVDRLAGAAAELDLLGMTVEVGRVVVEPSTAVTRTGLGSSVILLSGLLVGTLIGFVLALLRDRYDDRYRSVSAMDHFGVEEIARMPYVGEHDDDDSASAQVYGRLLVRLAFGPQRDSARARTVLLLPVESSSLPADIAETVATELRASSRGTGMSLSIIRNIRPASVRGGADGGNATSTMTRAMTTRDLVVLPQPALDGRPVGIGLAGGVDTTLLVVSDDTNASAIGQTIDDLRGVGAKEIKIAVVDRTGRFHLGGWRSKSARRTPFDEDDDSED